MNDEEELKLPKLSKAKIWWYEIGFWLALATGLLSVRRYIHSHEDIDLCWGVGMWFCMWVNYMVLHGIPREK